MLTLGVLPEAIPFSLPLDMTGVILEGARRSDEWRRIHKVFRSRLTTFALDPGSRDDLLETPDGLEEVAARVA